MKNRPIGIGVQGLADTYIQMGMAFEDQEALELNEKIFETIYYGAVEASIELAIKHGPYQSYKDSPTSQGLLQFDLWNYQPKYYDWSNLK